MRHGMGLSLGAFVRGACALGLVVAAIATGCGGSSDSATSGAAARRVAAAPA